MNPQTPGWKTSEFWAHAVPQLLSVLLASGALPQTWQAALGVLASALASAGYSMSRGTAKASPAPQATATAIAPGGVS